MIARNEIILTQKRCRVLVLMLAVIQLVRRKVSFDAIDENRFSTSVKTMSREKMSLH